ncbi:hypothetical protein FKP32DRAFT_1689129 [Trametes sanguinea]|nr:hypothetical protein FKP32DRAFT_1689129 [Trametes sanguinea]
MFAQPLLALALFIGAGTQLANAAVSSLYVPILNTEGVPLTVDVEGVDNTGHTTYLVQLGTPSGTYTADNEIVPPATLVEDSTTAHFVENVSGSGSSALGYTIDCSIGAGQASCIGVLSVFGTMTTEIDVEPVSSIEVQVAATPTFTPSITGTATSVPSGGSGASSAAGPSSTKKSGASRNRSSALGYAVVVGLVAGYFAW